MFLDEAEATEVLRRAGLTITLASPEYLRHKPGESSIISYRFAIEGGGTGRGYVHWCAQEGRATEVFEKASTLRPHLSAVGVSTIRVNPRTVFYGFPNDARLRRLRWYATPRKLRQSLRALAPEGAISTSRSTATVLRYKPERRVVAKVGLTTIGGDRRDLLVRYSTSARASILATTAEQLRQHGVRTPAPLAQLDGGHVSVDEYVPGCELRSWVRGGGRAPLELAQALDRFHRTPAPSGLPMRSPSDDLAAAASGLQGLAQRAPVLAPVAAAVTRLLEAGRPDAAGPPVLIHGDLHDRNVLIDGGEVWFIDLERAAIGHAASDLGRMRGHGISLQIRQPGWSPQALTHADEAIDEYRALGQAITASAVRWYTATALVDEAVLVARHLETGWQDSSQRLLDAAAGHLGALRGARSAPRPAPLWMTDWPIAYPRARGPWTVRDGSRWGVLVPETGRADEVDPSDDRRLPGLRGALTRGQLIGYRAGRRAIVATPTSFVKVVRPDRVAALVDAHDTLSRATPELRVPEVRACHADGRVELSALSGRSLHESPWPSASARMVEVASAVAALHDVRPSATLSVRTPAEPARWLDTVLRAEAGAGAVGCAALEGLISVLPAVEARSEVVVHGDLHDKNVIVGDGGAGLIDLDGLALGAREDDLANLGVHLQLRALQSGRGHDVGRRRADLLYAAYEHLHELDWCRLVAIEQHTWFRLACIYRFRRSSRGLVPELARLAAGRPSRG